MPSEKIRQHLSLMPPALPHAETDAYRLLPDGFCIVFPYTDRSHVGRASDLLPAQPELFVRVVHRFAIYIALHPTVLGRQTRIMV